MNAKDWFVRNQLDLFPLRRTFRSYGAGMFHADFRAAVNVALVAFPQGMAFALMAGLPFQFGVYCAAVASIVGGCLGSSRYTMLGPTNATAVLVLSSFILLPPNVDRGAYVALLGCMVGVLLTAGAFLRLADLTQFVSYSVVLGYLSGATLLIVANQIQYVFGIHPERATSFFHVLARTIKAMPQVDWPTLALGALTLAVWTFCVRSLKRLPCVAVTLIFVSLVAFGMKKAGVVVESLPPLAVGHWPLTLPRFSPDLFYQIAGAAMAIAFIAVLESSSMSKSLAHRSGDAVNANQDMFALGIGNICSACLSGMPASGSLSRSTLNWASGAATPLASIFSGLFCAAGVLLLGPMMAMVPTTSLAIVVICNALSIVRPRQIRTVLRATKSDAIVFLTTFIVSLVAPLDIAVYLGVGTSIVLFLRKARTPGLVEYTFNDEGVLCEMDPRQRAVHPEISIVHVEGELFFGASELFLGEIRRVSQNPNIRVVILRLKNARHLDATSVIALEDLIRYLRETGRDLLISGVMRDAHRVLRNSGLIEILGRDHLFRGSALNPNISTRNALRRAQQIIGREEASVRIFYDPSAQASVSGRGGP